MTKKKSCSYCDEQQDIKNIFPCNVCGKEICVDCGILNSESEEDDQHTKSYLCEDCASNEECISCLKKFSDEDLISCSQCGDMICDNCVSFEGAFMSEGVPYCPACLENSPHCIECNDYFVDESDLKECPRCQRNYCSNCIDNHECNKDKDIETTKALNKNLLRACDNDKAKKAEELIKEGADVNACDKMGNCLYYTINNYNLKLGKILAKKGAKLDEDMLIRICHPLVFREKEEAKKIIDFLIDIGEMNLEYIDNVLDEELCEYGKKILSK